MLETILGTGMKLLGGFMGKSSQDEANQIVRENAERNIQLQREFAQNGIQWKVADAQKAGIHPIYALGGSTTSFAPVSVGVSGANPLADSLQSMGQDVTRAASAYRSAPDRVSAVQSAQVTASNSLGLENQKLRNELLKIQIAKLTQPGTPPGAPYEVGEDKKEDNPPLMIGGSRVAEDPNWSPTKSVSDRWGDESFATNAYGNIRAVRDLYRTYMLPALGAYERWRSSADTSRLFGGSVSPRRDRPRGYY